MWHTRVNADYRDSVWIGTLLRTALEPAFLQDPIESSQLVTGSQERAYRLVYILESLCLRVSLREQVERHPGVTEMALSTSTPDADRIRCLQDQFASHVILRTTS